MAEFLLQGFISKARYVSDINEVCLFVRLSLARSTFVQGSLVWNIWKLQTESCTLSGKLHMTDEQINFSV